MWTQYLKQPIPAIIANLDYWRKRYEENITLQSLAIAKGLARIANQVRMSEDTPATKITDILPFEIEGAAESTSAIHATPQQKAILLRIYERGDMTDRQSVIFKQMDLLPRA